MMMPFTSLLESLNSHVQEARKIEHLIQYLEVASSEDASWAISLLLGNQPKKVFDRKTLWAWTIEFTQYPTWLIEECCEVTNNITEALLLMIPQAEEAKLFTLTHLMNSITDLQNLDHDRQKIEVFQYWTVLDDEHQQLFTKVLLGQKVAKTPLKTISSALAKKYDIRSTDIIYALSQKWSPKDVTIEELISKGLDGSSFRSPYPFGLGATLSDAPDDLGQPGNWRMEWKWTGLRVQLVKRKGEIHIWSRENLLNSFFPEFLEILDKVADDFVIDGQLSALEGPSNQSEAVIERRLKRKFPGPKFRQRNPIMLIAYDILEKNKRDLRKIPLVERTDKLEELVSAINVELPGMIFYSSEIDSDSWDALSVEHKRAREMNASGIVLKKKSGLYPTERQASNWIKWHMEPIEIMVTLLYVTRGTGIDSDSIDEFSLAVEGSQGQYIPVARVKNNLKDDDLQFLKEYVHNESTERFGPVKAVHPGLMFKLSFDRLRPSKRHKSGIKLINIREIELCEEHLLNQITRLSELKALLGPN